MDFLERIVYWFPGLLLSLTIHEFAHALVAYRCGDNTAKLMGRLNLNPLSHLDIFGTIMIFFGPFGWGKPVPVNPLNLANPKRDLVWVSLAGPVSNFLLAIVIGLFLRGAISANLPLNEVVVSILMNTFVINLVLMLFNLIPINPLDGEKIITGLLPYKQAIAFSNHTRHAPMVLMIVLLAGWIFNFSPLDFIFRPWITLWSGIIIG